MSSFVRQVIGQQIEDGNETAQRCLCLAHMVIHDNRDKFNDIATRMSSVSGNVRYNYARVLEEMFSDGVVNWGRIVTVLAFAIYMQHRFFVNLEVETERAVERHLFDWMMKRQEASSQISWSTYMLAATAVIALLLL